MNAVDLWARLALGVTWQLAALAALALLCERVLRLRQARVRHALWWFVLAAPLLLTPARLWLAHHQAAVAVTVPALPVTAIVAESPGAMSALDSPATASSADAPASPLLHLDPATTVALLWLLGSAALLTRLAAGHGKARRLLAASVPVRGGAAAAALGELSAQAGLARPVTLRTNASLSSLVLYGLLRPVILAPRAWLAELGPEDLQALLAHEVAHVRRRDVLGNLVQRAAEALLFFHPGAWLAGRRISLAREELCDAWALRQGTTPSSYARSLAAAAERALAQPALATVGLAESRFTLLQRVEAIMKGDGTRRTSRLALIALAAVAVVAASTFAAVQLRGQSADSEGSPPAAMGGGDGGGGGWHGAAPPPPTHGGGMVGGSPESTAYTPYRTADGYQLKPGFTPLAPVGTAGLDPKQVRHYAVGKRVSQYPGKVDFSRPELSYATIMRAMARGDQTIWKRGSVKRLAEKRSEPEAAQTKVESSYTRAILDTEIAEVWVYQERKADVVGRQKLPDGKTNFDIRGLELEGGRWLNTGNGFARTLEEARNGIAHGWAGKAREVDRQQQARNEALNYPLSFTLKAEQVFAELKAADYAHYLSPEYPHAWEEFPVDYVPNADKQTWVEWVCDTFSKNPIVDEKMGKLFRHEWGNPAVPYELTLQDGKVLKGDLQFDLIVVTSDSAYWTPRRGLDWHTPKKDTQ